LVKPDLRADRIGASDWNQGKETGKRQRRVNRKFGQTPRSDETSL
jgi:hypothetical protein